MPNPTPPKYVIVKTVVNIHVKGLSWFTAVVALVANILDWLF